MAEVNCRIVGRAGWITLARPRALNALTWEMCSQIRKALSQWKGCGEVDLVIIDALEERAFCAGGDIVKMYDHGARGDFDFGRGFWADQYRMDVELARFPKPIVSFLQGFTMGGGVGVGCHASHRIVAATSRIAMPECKIGLIPDVGGSLLLGRAAGFMGEYLALTAQRMDGGDAIYCSFADHFVPLDRWDALKRTLSETGSIDAIPPACETPPQSALSHHRDTIDRVFGARDVWSIARALEAESGAFWDRARTAMASHSPLAMACSVALIRRVRALNDVAGAVRHEYRYSARSMAQGDFLKGIRATLIDKDHAPKWAHASLNEVTRDDVSAMLAPLPEGDLKV